MTTKENLKKEDFSHLLELPRQKEIIDFVKEKLKDKNNKIKNEVVEELLEMYRTSTGFNPEVLTRIRFRRVKSVEWKSFLSQIDHDIEKIIDTPEYKSLIAKDKERTALYFSILELESLIKRNDFNGFENLFVAIKTRLAENREFELLLHLVRKAENIFSKQNSPEKTERYLQEYRELVTCVNTVSELAMYNLKATVLLEETRQGINKRNELLELYKKLCDLYFRRSRQNDKFDSLILIIRIAHYLENDEEYLGPFKNFTREHYDEIVRKYPDAENDLKYVIG